MLAKGTPLWLAVLPGAAILIAGVSWYTDSWALLIAAAPLVLLHAVLLLFFRDPERRVGEGVVSPADGKVMSAIRRGMKVELSIFMNVHNVHVNRAPMGGRVVNIEHVRGGFVPAFDKASALNERVKITVSGRHGRYEVTQIAGTVARRIVPYIGPGDLLEKGQRLGMIRFGSRVDLSFRLPPGCDLLVSKGDRVLAGSTTIADGTGRRGWGH